MSQNNNDKNARVILDLGTNVRTSFAHTRKGKKSNAPAVDDISQKTAFEIELHEVYGDCINCLSCGKVYDCRPGGQTAAGDIRKLKSNEGVCVFCGKHVIDGVTVGDVEQANALKNRLVLYDRESSRRTTVIDDQNEYYAIDSNVWMSDDEKKSMKETQRVQEEVRDTVGQRGYRVTIDLLGRKAVMAEPCSVDTNEYIKEDLEGGRGGAVVSEEKSKTKNKKHLEFLKQMAIMEWPQGGGRAAAPFVFAHRATHDGKARDGKVDHMDESTSRSSKKLHRVVQTAMFGED